MKVILSPAADTYIRSEASYLMARSPRAAAQFRANLRQLRRDLERFPEIGHPTTDLPVQGVRRFVIGAYLVDYELRKDAVVILAIRHGRERSPGLHIDDDFDFETPDDHTRD